MLALISQHSYASADGDCVKSAECAGPSGSALVRGCAAQIDGVSGGSYTSSLKQVTFCGMNAASAQYNCGGPGAVPDTRTPGCPNTPPPNPGE